MTKRILIVDDAMIIREMIKDVAVSEGWTVVGEAANGQQAFECYRDQRPDLVTLDLVMPVHDGLSALKAIIGHDPHACVLVVSAINQADILNDAVRLGAADFITKPFDKQRLRAAFCDRAAARATLST